MKPILFSIALVLIGAVAVIGCQVQVLADYVNHVLLPAVATTKTTTWYCSVHSAWETHTTSVPDAEAVRIAHERCVAKSKRTHIPGTPPPGSQPPN